MEEELVLLSGITTEKTKWVGNIEFFYFVLSTDHVSKNIYTQQRKKKKEKKIPCPSLIQSIKTAISIFFLSQKYNRKEK